MKTFIELKGCTISSVTKTASHLTISAYKRTKTALCPGCGGRSSSVHSYYYRSPADLPVSEQRARLCLRVRRFRCRNLACSRRTFAEPFPDLLVPFAQRTERFKRAQCAVAAKVGGEAGTVLLDSLHMPSSPATLLRLTRRIALPEYDTPRVLGVDDWSFRRGKTFGTILVDLEKRRVVDLLPDRSSDTLRSWLEQRPGIEIISRDRSSEYAAAASQAAPQAVQVTDRWHLLKNLGDVVQQWFERHR